MHLFVCGGGTGGHFFSGLAVAEHFLKLCPQGKVTFLGTPYGIEARVPLTDQRMKLRFIHAKGFKGKSLVNKMKGLLFLIWGVLESFYILIRERPSIVFGVGGYASAPTVVAALLLRPWGKWKINILDQNSSPGLANRFLSKFHVNAYCAFPFKGFQTVDLPIRVSIEEKAQQVREYQWPPQCILLMGGSQGSRGLNQGWKNIFPSVLQTFPKIRIIHQTGTRDYQEFQDFYKNFSVEAQVFEFSNEMPQYYEQADLLICRAGAMSIFEVMAFKRPAIFVPFPFAADDHQKLNALSVQKADWVIPEQDFNWEHIRPLLNSPQPSLPQRQLPAEIDWQSILSLSTTKNVLGTSS